MAPTKGFETNTQFFSVSFDTAAFFCAFCAIALFFIFAVPVSHASECDEDDPVEQEKCEKEEEEKEEKLKEEEEELKDEQKKIEKKLKKEKDELAQYQASLNSAAQTHSAAAAEVSKTKTDITGKEGQIEQYQEKALTLAEQTKIKQSELASILRELYYENNTLTAVEEIVDENGVHPFLAFKDYLSSFRARAANIIDDLDSQKQEALSAKAKVEEAKQAKEQLLNVQRVQEQSLAAERARAQQAVARQEATVGELNSELSKIKSSLSSLLGESVTAGDIKEAAKIASKKTGVRKDFILGMLTQETTLGRFTGGCTYKNANMKSADVPVFKDIAKDLDYNYKKLKVSCSAGYGYGGAMGVAQFLPRTWKQYESRVAKNTGHNPPDPWSLVDGVMAMAIKLANDGAASKSGEDTAARRYYCGSNLSRSVCANYAASVLYWAKNYERLL